MKEISMRQLYIDLKNSIRRETYTHTNRHNDAFILFSIPSYFLYILNEANHPSDGKLTTEKT